DFGFSTSDIKYLPDEFINTISAGPNLTYFILTPGSSVFQVASADKRIIFDYATYRTLSPDDSHTPVSSFVAALLPSGLPITTKPILVHKNDNSVFLLSNGSYRAVPSMDAFNCWGFGGVQPTF